MLSRITVKRLRSVSSLIKVLHTLLRRLASSQESLWNVSEAFEVSEKYFTHSLDDKNPSRTVFRLQTSPEIIWILSEAFSSFRKHLQRILSKVFWRLRKVLQSRFRRLECSQESLWNVSEALGFGSKGLELVRVWVERVKSQTSTANASEKITMLSRITVKRLRDFFRSQKSAPYTDETIRTLSEAFSLSEKFFRHSWDD